MIFFFKDKKKNKISVEGNILLYNRMISYPTLDSDSQLKRTHRVFVGPLYNIIAIILFLFSCVLKQTLL